MESPEFPRPESLKINGFVYQVRDLTEVERLKDHVIGFCDHESFEIAIWPDLQGQREVEVAIHEIFHAVFHAGDISPKDGEVTEEKLVTVLARQWLAVIRDNPD